MLFIRVFIDWFRNCKTVFLIYLRVVSIGIDKNMLQRLPVEEPKKEEVKVLEFGKQYDLHLFLINMFIASLKRE